VDEGTLDDESPQMRAFIQERRMAVLQRAIDTLATCDDHALADEAHRLAGTLGIFGLADASAEARSLMDIAKTPDASHAVVAVARTRTLVSLTRMAEALREDAP
jgi:HPt (histidine-containing phosphotransfer) domain-containing protein